MFLMVNKALAFNVLPRASVGVFSFQMVSNAFDAITSLAFGVSF